MAKLVEVPQTVTDPRSKQARAFKNEALKRVSFKYPDLKPEGALKPTSLERYSRKAILRGLELDQVQNYFYELCVLVVLNTQFPERIKTGNVGFTYQSKNRSNGLTRKTHFKTPDGLLIESEEPKISFEIKNPQPEGHATHTIQKAKTRIRNSLAPVCLALSQHERTVRGIGIIVASAGVIHKSNLYSELVHPLGFSSRIARELENRPFPILTVDSDKLLTEAARIYRKELNYGSGPLTSLTNLPNFRHFKELLKS